MARYVVGAVVLLALAAGYVAGQHPSTGRGAEDRRQCVGVATAVLRQNPTVTRVYRAFDDGTIESFDDGNPQAQWTQLGK
jgi:hypothetical protein